MEFTRPLPWPEAVDKIGRKSIVGMKLTSEEWARFPVAIRERAFISSTIENVRFLQRGRNLLTDFMTKATEEVTGPDGVTRTALKVGSRADFVKQMSEFAVREGMGPLDPKDQGTLKDIRSERRLGLIFDIQTNSAYSYAAWKEGMDPDTLHEFPAQRFIREADVIKPRPIHQDNENVVRLKTDLEFWLGMNSQAIGGFGVPWGPWGFGSGMGVEDVDRDEAEALGLVKPGEELQPVEKDLNERFEASLKGLDADLVKLVKDTLGGLVEIDGDSVKWVGDQAQPTTPPKVAPAPAPQPAPVPAPTPAPTPQPAPVPAPAKPKRTRKKAPAVQPTPAAPARKSPVSAAITNQTRGALRPKIDAALQAIDQVHDDGKLPNIPVTDTRQSDLGFIKWRGGPHAPQPITMAVRNSGPWPELTMVHETGHLLDLSAINGGASVASMTQAAVIQPVMTAIKATAKYQSLVSHLMAASSYRQRQYYNYLKSDVELWARAYAQFIAQRSPSAELKRQLQLALQQEPLKQWDPADFAPVDAAIEAMFKQLGWL